MRRFLPLFLASFTLLASCARPGSSSNDVSNPPVASSVPVVIETKEIRKDEYRNKTLGGLLGQMAGFLSGYEFVWDGPLPRLVLPEHWFSFCYGPYAGNYQYYEPSGDTNTYNRLKNTGLHGEKEIASDDDYHLDIFNQTIIDEYGVSSKAITDAWYDYKVFDWGGGADAMSLINKNKMLAPYTGTIESGNRYGWCTEAYIENETLGMNAGGMPNLAVDLTDVFASNVGYYDPVIWAKFYAACYSIAYFDDDVYSILEKAKPVLPVGSWPREMYELAYEAYREFPSDMASAAEKVATARRNLYRLDNVQTDPSVNGGFTVLSLLYGGNSYMDVCKWASLMGYDGDCTAATATGLLGIIKGFKEGNPEYETINEAFYHYGEGTYYNDQNYTTRIGNVEKYGLHIKIDDIVSLYVKNFEKLLLQNGGSMDDTFYYVPVSTVKADSSICFDNNDGENRNLDNWQTSGGGSFTNIEDTGLDYIHAGSFGFQLTNDSQTAAYHRFANLRLGSHYRVSTYVKTANDTTVLLYANDGEKEQSISFANTRNLLNKDFIFEATSSTMDVGFRFALSAKAGDILYFDDFFIEEVEHETLHSSPKSTLSMSTDSFTQAFTRPDGVEEGEEVVIRLNYAQKTGGTISVEVLRNNETFGTVLASNTGYSLSTFQDVLEIPYVFAKNTDYVKLSFPGSKIAFGSIEVIRKASYSYR